MKLSDQRLPDALFHPVTNVRQVVGTPTPIWVRLQHITGACGYGLIAGWDGNGEPVFVMNTGRLAHFQDGTILWVVYPS